MLRLLTQTVEYLVRWVLSDDYERQAGYARLISKPRVWQTVSIVLPPRVIGQLLALFVLWAAYPDLIAQSAGIGILVGAAVQAGKIILGKA